jgi:hypothetical protein
LNYLAAAEPDHDNDGQADHQLHRRVENALYANQFPILGNQGPIHSLELLDLMVLLNERLHDPDAGHALLHARAEVRQLALRLFSKVVNLLPEMTDAQRHCRQRQQGQ